jgi:hypothetical protein
MGTSVTCATAWRLFHLLRIRKLNGLHAPGQDERGGCGWVCLAEGWVWVGGWVGLQRGVGMGGLEWRCRVEVGGRGGGMMSLGGCHGQRGGRLRPRAATSASGPELPPVPAAPSCHQCQRPRAATSASGPELRGLPAGADDGA